MTPWLSITILCLTVLATTGDAGESYQRSDWPHWLTRGCQSVRTRVLIRDSRPGAQHRDPGDVCSPLSWGAWLDPYTGKVIHDPARIDVDHLVPLQHAHEHGGASWSRERKKAYANDMGDRAHLQAVSASANRAKGAQGPVDWLPSNPAALCDYVRAWAVVKFIWTLDASPAERAKVREVIEASCS